MFWTGFCKQAGVVAKAKDATKAVFKGLSQKTEPAVLNYHAIQEADRLARRAKAAAAGGTIDYSKLKAPAPTASFESWSKLNQAKRAKMVEQEASGVIK